MTVPVLAVLAGAAFVLSILLFVLIICGNSSSIRQWFMAALGVSLLASGFTFLILTTNLYDHHVSQACAAKGGVLVGRDNDCVRKGSVLN